MQSTTDTLLSAAEVAVRLGVAKQTVYALARAGVVPRVMVGRLVRFRSGAVDDFLMSGGGRYDRSDTK